MVKNIVLCSDGTGSKGIQKRGTNVYKLYEAVDLHGYKTDKTIPKQIAFYDDGVGTQKSKIKKILGSAFGYGLSKNVKDLYADLVRTYNVGDRIYLFGFSRGAFTVRTLAGLIMTCGIIDRRNLKNNKNLMEKVEMAYREYRSKYTKKTEAKLTDEEIRQSATRFREKNCYFGEKDLPTGEVPIEFIGVWDTVDAVGVPIDKLADFINNFIYRFKFVDSKISRKDSTNKYFKIKKACHV